MLQQNPAGSRECNQAVLRSEKTRRHPVWAGRATCPGGAGRVRGATPFSLTPVVWAAAAAPWSLLTLIDVAASYPLGREAAER